MLCDQVCKADRRLRRLRRREADDRGAARWRDGHAAGRQRACEGDRGHSSRPLQGFPI